MGDGQENGARRRILVVANETVAGRALWEEIVARAAFADVEVFILCPALNSKIRHWFSDDDGARVRATERLEASLDALADVGVRAQGDIGDSNPLQAMDDAVRVFRPHEIIVSTHPPGRSNWLEKGVVERSRARFDVPITHVVVDLAQEQAPVRHARPVRTTTI